MAFNPRAAGGTATLEWHGNRLTSHMQYASRRALEKAGGQMVEIAQTTVRWQTGALHNSIRAEVPRRESGTRVYRLVFGVWDHPENQLRHWDGRVENPADYAYFQETQPDRGTPFIRPAVDAIAPYLGEYIREALPRLSDRGVLDFGASFEGFTSMFDAEAA